MFEKFFGPKNEEQIERILYDVASKEFEHGVGAVPMHKAFFAVKKVNEEEAYGVTNNRLLNIVRDCALGNASELEDSLMGGREQVVKNINSEIEILRNDLPKEEQGN